MRMLAMPPFVPTQMGAMLPLIEEAFPRTVCAGLRRFASRQFGAGGLGRGGDGRADHQGQRHR